MAHELPTVINLRLPTKGAGEIDTEVYCINTTPHPYRVAVESTGFTTIDDEGALLHHGSAPVRVTIQPGEVAQIGDVVAWEWDGHVGLVIEFSNIDTGYACRATYNLKYLTDHRTPDFSGLQKQIATKIGYIIPPGIIKHLAQDDTTQLSS